VNRPSPIAITAAAIGIALLACKQPGHGRFLFSGVFAAYTAPAITPASTKPRQCRQAPRSELERILLASGKCL